MVVGGCPGGDEKNLLFERVDFAIDEKINGWFEAILLPPFTDFPRSVQRDLPCGCTGLRVAQFGRIRPIFQGIDTFFGIAYKGEKP